MRCLSFINKCHEKYDSIAQLALFLNFAIVSIYILSIFITRGLVFAIHPDYNSGTGCPIGMRTCDDNEKMICSDNHMRSCYALSFLTTAVMMSLLSLVAGVIVLIGRTIRERYQEADESTPDDEQELLKETPDDKQGTTDNKQESTEEN